MYRSCAGKSRKIRKMYGIVADVDYRQRWAHVHWNTGALGRVKLVWIERIQDASNPHADNNKNSMNRTRA